MTNEELAAALARYAEHTYACMWWHHRHKNLVDRRVECASSPCTCGLIDVLQKIRPNVVYTEPCTLVPGEPEQPRTPPIWGSGWCYWTRQELCSQHNDMCTLNHRAPTAGMCQYYHEFDCLAARVRTHMSTHCGKQHHVPHVPKKPKTGIDPIL